MHSKTMSQAVGKELCDVELHDAFPPKRNRFSPLDRGTVEENEIEGQTGSETYLSETARDEETEIGKNGEKAGDLRQTVLVEVDLVRDGVPAVCSYPAIQGQAQCKSDEDDGYCSRSSLDSPVQTMQSDSEANDPEVFTLKEGSMEATTDKTEKITDRGTDTVTQKSDFKSSCPPPSSAISSSVSSHSGGPKILIVNKNSNVKYILPAMGRRQTHLSVPGIAPAASVDAVPSTTHVQPVQNLVDVKIVGLDPKKVLPQLSTSKCEPEKENPASTSIPTSLSTSDDAAAVGLGRRFVSVSNVPVIIKASSKNLGNSGRGNVSVKAAVGNPLSTTAPVNSLLLSRAITAEPSTTAERQGGIIVQNDENSDVSAVGTTPGTVDFDHESDTTLNCGPETFSGEVCVSVDATGKNRLLDLGRSTITPHVSVGHGKVVLKQENVSALRKNIIGAGTGSRTEHGTVFRTLGKSDLQNASKPFIGENDHGRVSAEFGSKSSTYQLMNHTSQDVTVILLPQNSVQTIAKKSSVVCDTPCKQVLLRTGQGQLFKAITVNSDGFKTSTKVPEKLVHSGGDGTKLILNSMVRGTTVGIQSSESAAKCLNCKDDSVTSRTTNGGVSGSRLVDNPASSVRKIQNSEKVVARSSASIGHFASLTLPGLHATSGTKTVVRGLGNVKPTALSIAGHTKSQITPAEFISPRAKIAETSRSSSRGRISCQNIPSTPKPCHTMTSLHPLIDHDYCEFSAFCAEVQSSIISLTESSIRPERRYVKKNRAARTKAMRVSQYALETGAADNRPKRKYCKKKHSVDGGSRKKNNAANSKLKGHGKISAAQSKGSAGAVKDGVQTTDDKDYVKIPGYYQDEYVYYATKRLPGRPRNRAESAGKTAETVVAKQQTTASSSISMFDWYKEMAQTDKTTRFGSDCNIRKSDLLDENGLGKDCTPVNESDVADLVMDLLPSAELGRPISDEMKYMSTSIVESLLSNSYDLSALGSEMAADVGNTDLNLMAEEVRMMLNSMGEAELKMLESHLENEKISDEMHVDGLDINSYLGDYVTQETNMSQASASNFLDVDDINDGDLLSADITNMNIILNDLKSSNRPRITDDASETRLASAGITSLFEKSVDHCNDVLNGVRGIGLGFEKDTELSKTMNNANKTPILGVSAASSLPISSEPVHRNIPVSSDTSPPELTTINMFWNDLPGLLINGREFVRLVDIHKQIMPAKDTGILKKRCHMMGLHITNCTELQRDFLIRYMNAAKSKSTVIIAKDAAIMLIGFYVNPKSRIRGLDDLELDVLIPSSKPTKFASKQDPLSQLTGGPKDKDLMSSSDLSPIRSLPNKIPNPTAVKAMDYPQMPIQLMADSSSSANAAGDVKRSERLRHKHISYSHMVHGGVDEGEKITRLDGTVHPKFSPTDCSTGSIVGATKLNAGVNSHLVTEQEELENLIREQKRRRLSLEEKLRLKLLRNVRKSTVSRPRGSNNLGLRKTRKRLIKRTRRTRRLLAWKRGQAILKGAPGDLHTLEHCYAALPAPASKHTDPVELNSDHHHRTTRNCNQSAESLENLARTVAPQPSALKVCTVTGSKSNSVAVIHRDITCRVNRRRRSQLGELVPHLYTSNDAPCIRCSNCREMLTVAGFMKHMHWRHGSDKLVRITIAQKLQLQSSARMPESVAAWEAFQKKRALFESALEADCATISPCKEKSPKTTQESGTILNTPDPQNTVPSTRHSNRVLKRKQLNPVENRVRIKFQSGTEVATSDLDPKKLRHANESEKPLIKPVNHHLPVASVENVSNPVPHCKRAPLLNGAKNRRPKTQRRRTVVQSDRLLRVTTRRSHDS